MARQDGDLPHRPRPRSSTNSFVSSFSWRRRLNEPSPAAPPVSSAHAQETKTLQEIVASLTPPGVLSPVTARQLVEALKVANIPGNTQGLIRVLSALCCSELSGLRIVGYEALSAYLGNPSTPALSEHERFVLFSLFPSPAPQLWNFEVWEKAQPALQVLTRDGTEVVGIEIPLLRLLRSWVEGAVFGLLSPDNISLSDRAQREQSVSSICEFLTRTMTQAKTMARLSEEESTNMLQYLGDVVDRSLLIPTEVFGSPPLPAEAQQAPTTPTRLLHRRHHSSTSITQVTPSGSATTHALRRPSDVTVDVYIKHLSAQMRYMSPSHLMMMLPVLFRALAFYSSPLPRLSLTKNSDFDTEHEVERHIIELLHPLLNGAYSSTCFVIMKCHTLPDVSLEARVSVQTSLGACRALRLYWRRALCARLARALLARATSDNYTPSGAPGGMDIDTSLMERAWQKDEVTRGELNRVGRLFRRASEAWVGLTPDNGFVSGAFNEREEVLSEIVGAVRDVFQEYDLRGDLEDVDEEEKGVIGGILGSLTDFVHHLKSDSDGSAYILPLSHYADAKTPFLRDLSTLLAREHRTTPTVPPLTSILLSISDHLSDSSTARTVEVMLRRGDLSPISMDWITHWAVILNKPELSAASRPMTRVSILDAMQNVFQSIRDVPVHRVPFVDVILASCQAHEVEKDRDGYEVVWHVLADEMIMRMSEAQELVWNEEADKEGSDTVGPRSAEATADAETVTADLETVMAEPLELEAVDEPAPGAVVDLEAPAGAESIVEPDATTELDAAIEPDTAAEPDATDEPEASAELDENAADVDVAEVEDVEVLADTQPEAESEESVAEVEVVAAEDVEGEDDEGVTADEAADEPDGEAEEVAEPTDEAAEKVDEAVEEGDGAGEGDIEAEVTEEESKSVEGTEEAAEVVEEGTEDAEDAAEEAVAEAPEVDEAVAAEVDAPEAEVGEDDGGSDEVDEEGAEDVAEGSDQDAAGVEDAAEDVENEAKEDEEDIKEDEDVQESGGAVKLEDEKECEGESGDAVEGEDMVEDGDTIVEKAEVAEEDGGASEDDVAVEGGDVDAATAAEEGDVVVEEGDAAVEEGDATDGEIDAVAEKSEDVVEEEADEVANLDITADAAEEVGTDIEAADTEISPEVAEQSADNVDDIVTDVAVVEDALETEETVVVKDEPLAEEAPDGLMEGLASEPDEFVPTEAEVEAKPSVTNAETLSPGAKATSAALQFVDSVLNLLAGIATNDEDDEPEPPSAASPTSVPPSNPFSRSHSEYSPPVREKEPGLMSLLSAFASGVNSRSQSQQTPRSEDTISIADTTHVPETVVPVAVGAVVTLIHIFSQLAFTPYATSEQSKAVAIRIFKTFVTMLREAKSSRVRLTVLQFFFRLRVDRDHRLFTVYERYDRLGHIASIAAIIQRTEPAPGTTPAESTAPPPEEDVSVAAATRARALQRDGRRASRGRDRPDRSASSRSRSRVASRLMSPTDVAAPSTELGTRKLLWRVPEALPFKIPESDTPSDGLMSYDPETSDNSLVLPTSSMLHAFIDILCSEKDWEIMAYVLCHLPTLLANKHLFCGPKSRQAMTVLLETLCNGILAGELGKPIAQWPLNLRPRDAQGLAFHTLSVLISYRDCFSAQQRHILVEVLMSGLSAQQSTVKACIQALSIAAFELGPSVRRFLPDVLTKLSQIMTNASIATHIIDFLAIVGSQPSLYANFIERDFKMVFGVALQYLRLHNRPDSPESTSVLSQHVRLMSFSIVYIWFLAVKLADRPKHVKYITRQLLLANEGRDDVDEPTEVCFDWLARYTYSSGDPRPASSMLSEIIMKPNFDVPQSDVVAEKAWIVGNALVSIRALTKLGWLEVSARRPSGLTRFLARVENIPMVGAGEVDPDTVSVPAILAMDRKSSGEEDALYQEVMKTIFPAAVEDNADEEQPQRPDPITGYVWQGTAPSQRRKEVGIDPSFFALQLSSYPGSRQNTRIQNLSAVPTFLRTFDRMPVIDTHKVGILYVAPGQSTEIEILGNVHGSPAYTRFLEGLGRLINLRGQKDVYAGGLDPDEDGEYAYAFWDDIGQVLYHTATLMPNHDYDPQFNTKKRHIGNDFVRIVWNDSGIPYRFDTLSTQFQFCNIVIEPHSLGAIAAFSDSQHANEYFRVTVQRAAGMRDFAPLGDFKLISAQNLPLLVRQLSLLADWYSSVYQFVSREPGQEMETNWRSRLRALKRFRAKQQEALKPADSELEHVDGILAQEAARDFTSLY